jgi:hypothetical protein
VARDAIARLDDVNKDSVKRVYDRSLVTFEAGSGRSIDLGKLHAALKATRLSGKTGSVIHYLEIRAAGKVEVAGAELVLHVSGTKQSFVLASDDKLKGEAVVDVRDALNRGQTVTSVTGRVLGWSGHYPKVLAKYPPGEMPPPRPVLAVTDFEFAK